MNISKLINKCLTNNSRKIMLFYVTFSLKKYLKDGEKDSCMLHIHPNFKDDPIAKAMLENLVEHIRRNHDMNDLL